MQTRQTIAPENMGAALLDLADAAKYATTCAGQGSAYAVGSICAAVANLCAGAGPAGGMKQAQMIAAATSAGFACEYWGASLRVSWAGKE